MRQREPFSLHDRCRPNQNSYHKQGMHRDIRLEGQLKWNCILGRGLDDKTVEV